MSLGTVLVAVADSGKVAGPLVGHVETKSAGLWMYLPDKAEGVVRFWEEGTDGGRQEVKLVGFDAPATTLPGQATTATLSGLRADTRYAYEVLVNGKGNPAWKGGFETPGAVGEPAAFRMALTSCMKFGQPQASWYLLLAQQPDLHLTVGDTHYADTTDPNGQLEHHLRYRREPFVATVHRQVPTYSIWDDHDYGPNDSDGTAEGKERSLAGWKQFWMNPGAGTPETPGAFYKFTRGEVEFFVVDGRYHRSPDKAPDDDRKRMLGDAQFEWLMDGLKNSKAKFKVIASGSTLHHSKGDGWRIYTFSRHRLFDGIRENKVSGVMYMSGDIHASTIAVHHESERVGYPLVEVISSGIANSGSLSFATIDFDTTVADATARVRIVYGDGTVREDRTWKLSELSHGE
ncbi:alkaline phosphatase D family protein [Haloferula sp. A504]|uniref:alkaline phosphatase D family protein n=1 Tax=Haloferula sp. A504 TaxID=3373601 RepID=UPI0031C95C56|nr:alkaline phosphatase family protein [Verrucomicrobiaceae bacterium E54]